LTRDIHQKIARVEKRPVETESRLRKIKRFLWPERIGFRLVGLTATAVIVLLVVQQSLRTIRQPIIPGKAKLEALQEIIDKEDTVPSTSGQAGAGAVVWDEPLLKTVETEAASEEEKGVPPAPAGALEDRETHAVRRRGIPSQVPVTPARQEERARDESLGFAEKPVLLEESEQNVLAAEPAIPEGVADISAKERPPDQTYRALKVTDKHESTSDVDVFEAYARESDAAQSVLRKIQLWETYLESNPPSPFSENARLILAGLYYEQAKESMKEDDLRRALKFHREQTGRFASEKDNLQIRNQIDDLNALLKKIQEK
jgi:hypothetical protein